jgi:4-diphosphocytidyl-2-C-methyl-D-erythritol kinase
MVTFPFCKINLGLQVIAKRPDNYHDIATCFYPVPWTDVLEVVAARSLTFTQTGLTIPGAPDDNLCVKAYNLLKTDHKIRPVKIHLHKIIPTGAGLGGGSSDAAHMLIMLRSVFRLNLDDATLIKYAAQLGSDCTFFMQHKPVIGRDRGDKLTGVNINLKDLFLVLVTPDVQVSTADAYAGVVPQVPTSDIAAILDKPVTSWKPLLKNDFELSVFKRHPVLAEIKEKFYSLGAVYASMSGSGSSVYGIFDREVSREEHFKGASGWSGWL